MSLQKPTRGAEALARRLRKLRVEHWPEAGLTQPQLARALGGEHPLAASSISSWESSTAGRVPPPDRLSAYATFFATRRSLDGDHRRVLPFADLTAAERQVKATLERELLSLRAVALGDAPGAAMGQGFWHFPDGAQVRLICGLIPAADRSPYTDIANPNHIELLSYADLDALVELFGHVRASNPDSDARFRLARDVEPDDLTGHVALIGGAALNEATGLFAELIDLPVVQDRSRRSDIFVLRHDAERSFMPTFRQRNHEPVAGAGSRRGQEPQAEVGSQRGELVEDVGLLARMPNPRNPERTLTMCGGIHTRGVYGAVRCLTDANLRDAHAAYLDDRFGRARAYGLLMRVPIFEGKRTIGHQPPSI